jgi:hypothetical protein
MRPAILVRTILILALIWGAVWAVRAVAGSMKATAARVLREADEAALADWSRGAPGDPAEAAAREARVRKLAALINRLDYQERALHRRNGTAERVFARLSPAERRLFVDLTITPALDSLLRSLGPMSAKQRRRFISQGSEGLADEGLDTSAIERASQLFGPLEPERLRAALDQAPPELVFQLGPLVESINEALQGMDGHGFGPPRRSH